MGEEKQKGPGKKGKYNTRPGGEFDCRFYPFAFPGAVVEAHDRLGAVCQPVGGHGDDLTHGVDDRHDAHVQVAAVALQGGVAHDLDRAVCDGHDKAGQSQSGNFLYDSRLRFHVSGRQSDHCLLPGEEMEDPHSGDELGDDGGQRGSPDAHAEHKDKKRVKDQVQHSSDGHGEHSCDSEPLGVDKVVHAKAYHHKESAAQVDGKIGIRIGVSHIAGAKKIHQRTTENIAQDSQYQAAYKKHGKGVCHDLFCLFRLAAAPCNGKKRSAACAEQVGEGSDDGDDRERETDPCQCLRGCMGDVADVDPVHHII